MIKKHIGGDFDDFLRGKHLLDDAEAVAAKRVIAFQIDLEGRRQTRREHERVLETITASDVMASDLLTVRDDEPMERALVLMTEHRLKRLPVVTADARFVGVLSRDAVIRASLAHSQS